MTDFGTLGLPGLYRAMPEQIKAKLDGLGEIRRYDAGQLIQNRGDHTRGFSIIKKGAVRFGKIDAEGRFIAAAVFEPGQCYGEFTLFADLPRTHDGFAVGETHIQHVGKPAFDRLLVEEPALSKMLLSSLTKQLHSVLEWIDDMRRYPLKIYLGKRLLQRAAGGVCEIKVTQTELAETFGVSRVAIGKALSDYQRRGFIGLRYGRIEICDAAGFKQWLDGYVQLETMNA